MDTPRNFDALSLTVMVKITLAGQMQGACMQKVVLRSELGGCNAALQIHKVPRHALAYILRENIRR